MATDPSLRSACLTNAVRLVRSRIESDGAYIAGHETRTRQFLIDPVLTALGWTVLDPALVILEAPAQGGRADYSLHERQYSVLVVEAKRLGSSLLGEPVDQATTYGHWLGSEFVVVTDGDYWHMYGIRGSVYSGASSLMHVHISGVNDDIATAQLSMVARDNLIG